MMPFSMLKIHLVEGAPIQQVRLRFVGQCVMAGNQSGMIAGQLSYIRSFSIFFLFYSHTYTLTHMMYIVYVYLYVPQPALITIFRFSSFLFLSPLYFCFSFFISLWSFHIYIYNIYFTAHSFLISFCLNLQPPTYSNGCHGHGLISHLLHFNVFSLFFFFFVSLTSTFCTIFALFFCFFFLYPIAYSLFCITD